MTIDPRIVVFPEREVALWALAARRQIERWEFLVAKYVLAQPNFTPPPDPPIVMTVLEVWQGETERHFLLIAAAHLVKALGLLNDPPVIDTILADEIREARDLNEHWDQNRAVFGVMEVRLDDPPRRLWEPGRRSGKDFAARNPQATPYSWWSWDRAQGPLVTPNVPATTLHELIETAIAAADAVRSGLAASVSPPAPRPWHIPPPGQTGWFPDVEAVRNG